MCNWRNPETVPSCLHSQASCSLGWLSENVEGFKPQKISGKPKRYMEKSEEHTVDVKGLSVLDEEDNVCSGNGQQTSTCL